MSTIIAAQEFLSAAGASAFGPNGVILAEGELDGKSIASTIREFIGPIVMLAVGIAALVFLFKREMTKFFQFAALAVGVAVFFFAPNFLENVGLWVSGIFGGDGIDTNN